MLFKKGKLEITIRELLEIIGCNYLECNTPIDDLDKVIDNIRHNGLADNQMHNGKINVVFDVWPQKSTEYKYIEYIKKGVYVISAKNYNDARGIEYRSILVDNALDSYIKLGKAIRRYYNIPTITITGSVGKTTTIQLLQAVFNTQYKVFVSGNNRNTAPAIVDRMAGFMTPEHTIHIQETGGGRSKLVEESQKMLTPNAFGITKISTSHHIDGYKNSEDIVMDKTSADRNANEGAFGIINLDDVILSKCVFKNRIITYAVDNHNADYLGCNIVQNGAFLELDVKNNGCITHLKTEILGEHNAYNILMTYAFAKEYGISDENIKRGLLDYHSSRTRQRFMNIAGRLAYIDCFNVCSDSIKSSVKTLNDFTLKEGRKKIAVIGGENALAEKTFEVNFETGQSLASYKKIDEYIFLGPPEPATLKELNYYGNGRSIYEGARSKINDIPIKFTTKLNEVADYLTIKVHPGDMFLLKGIFRIPLFAALDMAYGTSFTIYDPNFIGSIVKDENFIIKYYKPINGSNIIQYMGKNNRIIIPDCISDYPITRVGRRVFRSNPLKSVVIGNNVANIGEEGFENCVNLRFVEMPDSMKFIENNAFANCVNLETAILNKTMHISNGAFANCVKLKRIELGSECGFIGEDAFKGCSPELTIFAPKGSYAAEYAKEQGIIMKEI